jgi:EAL domain-containing protein (putative c-di-GMP-specific phosphodiesterase class I)
MPEQISSMVGFAHRRFADESGLIPTLSNWVMETDFEHASGWPEQLFV